MSQYLGINPNAVAGQTLLKINFITHVWPDTLRKLEKLDGWQERGLEDLLKEAQKVYVKRDEKKVKAKARVMAAAIREGNQHLRNNSCKGEGPRSGEDRRKMGGHRWDMISWDGTPKREIEELENLGPICFYCKKKGHFKTNCPQREMDLKAYKNEQKGEAED